MKTSLGVSHSGKNFAQSQVQTRAVTTRWLLHGAFSFVYPYLWDLPGVSMSISI